MGYYWHYGFDYHCFAYKNLYPTKSRKGYCKFMETGSLIVLLPLEIITEYRNSSSVNCINISSTGLGLAIARTLIEQMNRTISAKYFENKLSICISFPDIKV